MNNNSRKNYIWLWPDINPTPSCSIPGVFYLSWPTWEQYRMKYMITRESSPTSSLEPFLIDDPPNFIGSLNSLIEEIKNGNPYWLSRSHVETSEDLARLINSPNTSKKKAPSPAPLILALWSYGESARQESAALLARAKSEEKRLWNALTDEDPELGEDYPVPSLLATAKKTIRKAWFELAGPHLLPGDRLWPSTEDFRETARDLFSEDPNSPELFILDSWSQN